MNICLFVCLFIYLFIYLKRYQHFIHICVHLFPACHDDVVKIIRLACKHNAAVIPYGGRYLLVAHPAALLV